ncbi:MAG: putative Ig domain-containing protein, partial [Proteobacteria bacterium]|nr:putative Ig domain-containing protein [Pseudomonadota bacterium]
TNTGLAVKATAGCAVSRALPAGLTIAAFDDAGKMTCQITGNPSAAADKATYVITATATNNGTDEARVTITVSDPLASPRLPDETIFVAATAGTLLAAPVLVENTEGNADITDCKFVDTANSDAQVATLAGLSITAATNGRACEITGTPTEAGAQSFTVRAMSATGQDDATVLFAVAPPKPLGLVRQLSVHGNTCAISADDELYCWGFNGNSRLGLGDTENRNTPTKVGIATNWSQVNSSNRHTCAINATGELYCWGDGIGGKLGLGDTDGRTTPTKVGTANWSQISGGAGHSCAINATGELYCWGASSSGQLGLGFGAFDTGPFLTPTKVGTAINWSQVSVDQNYSCAINATGELYCWGSGGTGQLGLGDTSLTFILNKVGTATNWSQISTGQQHSCAINTIGELYCWGEGEGGRLGLGDTNDRNTPTKVGTATNWSQISAGQQHTCAINTIGELYCWGVNRSEQLGLGETDNRNTPTKVGTATNWSQISAGILHTCAVNATSQLHCWGNNFNGVLGLGTNMNQNTPQAVTIPRTPTAAPDLENLIITGSEAPARFNNGMFDAGTTIPPLTYTNTGGDAQPDGCAIDTTSSRPTLPAGLRPHPIFSGSIITCQITGIPTEAATMATYYLTAANAIGTSEAVTVSFQVDLVRPLLADAPEEQSYTMGTAITTLTFTNTGLAVKATDGCTVSPALPLGLTLAAFNDAGTMTCQITGNPSVVATKATYVITATATDNSTDEARVTITVAPDPLASPLLADIATEQSYTMGTAITPLTFTNTGLDVKTTAGCTVSPALPLGLTLAAFNDAGKMTCQITGNPSVVAAKATYVITATAT